MAHEVKKWGMIDGFQFVKKNKFINIIFDKQFVRVQRQISNQAYQLVFHRLRPTLLFIVLIFYVYIL